jgi:hypothetical protein
VELKMIDGSADVAIDGAQGDAQMFGDFGIAQTVGRLSTKLSQQHRGNCDKPLRVR